METSERNMTDDGAPKRRLNSSIVAAGVAFGITLAGLGVAAAQKDSSSDTTAAPTTPAAPNDSGSSGSSGSNGSTAPADRPARPAETALTGDAAAKVSAAALAAVPGGTIIRVETDSDGSPYEAHVRKADGTEVVVKVNEAFAVTGTEEGGHRGGHHGPGGGSGETALTGDVADKVSAAALAAVPGGSIIRVETDSDGSPYEAHVRKADGTEVVVKVNEAFAVTGTEAGGGPGGPGHHGPRPDDGTEQETD